ncbi:MAG TPA: hypothetical protein ENN39_11205 [Desulfonatronum sp.]|nr:hypothetical protein [Desulfonatronum sp.]
MRYSLLIIIALTLMNIYHTLKPMNGDGGQPAGVTKEYRFNIKNDLELLKAKDEIQILKMILERYRATFHDKELELDEIREENLALNTVLAGYREANTHRLRLSAYTARPQECNDDPENTALMHTPKPGWTVAVSHDLKGWLGKRVYVQGFGVRLVSDLMNSRHEKSLDLLVGDVSAAKSIGVRRNVLVTLIEPFSFELERKGFDDSLVLME